jgi:hypothetical protein
VLIVRMNPRTTRASAVRGGTQVLPMCLESATTGVISGLCPEQVRRNMI